MELAEITVQKTPHAGQDDRCQGARLQAISNRLHRVESVIVIYL
jgi:hypothetical protein